MKGMRVAFPSSAPWLAVSSAAWRKYSLGAIVNRGRHFSRYLAARLR
jgi:hypothetical protein